ncbi:hypothetical protein MJO28_002501 [Puccinia striiformis f. sp. tritici]|uniref:Uncharacterized protein n=1 Tax=Puccinia striiformis f. sp. tritici TaxID=168172 RepID=A0ACC0ES61_9BASI|nr:hypothetical protein MJO28_002501 [Puccinia striiformis f. sp. tritici]
MRTATATIPPPLPHPTNPLVTTSPDLTTMGRHKKRQKKTGSTSRHKPSSPTSSISSIPAQNPKPSNNKRSRTVVDVADESEEEEDQGASDQDVETVASTENSKGVHQLTDEQELCKSYLNCPCCIPFSMPQSLTFISLSPSLAEKARQTHANRGSASYAYFDPPQLADALDKHRRRMLAYPCKTCGTLIHRPTYETSPTNLSKHVASCSKRAQDAQGSIKLSALGITGTGDIDPREVPQLCAIWCAQGAHPFAALGEDAHRNILHPVVVKTLPKRRTDPRIAKRTAFSDFGGARILQIKIRGLPKSRTTRTFVSPHPPRSPLTTTTSTNSSNDTCQDHQLPIDMPGLTRYEQRNLLIRAALGLVGLFFLVETSDNEPYYSDGGQAMWATFLLEEARPELFREVTSLERPTFDALVDELQGKELLADGRSVTVEEQLLMFLDGVVHNNSMRQTAVIFRRGLYTVLPRCTRCTSRIVPKYVVLNQADGVPERLQDPKYRPFNKCLGALDGVFIPVTLPSNEQAPYQNRKQFIAQNVLAVVNFDFQFVYLLAGWEGSAHDGTVLADAFTKEFSILEGRFYLADAGYGLQKGILTPYRATRYHLKEQAAAGLRPENVKELYNLRHASLRNMVERIFGCMKAKFKVLTTPSQHSIHQQVQLVYALAVVWNFLRRHDQIDNDDYLHAEPEESSSRSQAQPEAALPRRTNAEYDAMKKKRDRVAEKLWTQYQSYLARR